MFYKRVCLFHVLQVLSKLTPRSSLRDGRIPQFVEPWNVYMSSPKCSETPLMTGLSLVDKISPSPPLPPPNVFCSKYYKKYEKSIFSAHNILCSEYHEISMLRDSAPNIMKYINIDVSTLCSPLLSLPEDIWDDIAIMPLF